MMSSLRRASAPIRYWGVVDSRLFEVDVAHRLLGAPDIDLRIDGQQVPAREEGPSDQVETPAGMFWTIEPGSDGAHVVSVRRPRDQRADGGDAASAEEGSDTHRVHCWIVVRSRSLGRAGEVEVRRSRWGSLTALLAAEGTPSALRDASLRAHPYRRAVQRGVWTSLKYIVPLLGLREIVDRLTQPAQEAAEEAVRPTATWIAQLLEPIGRLFGAIADVIGALFGWVVPVLQFLFGWVPPLLDWLPDWSFGPFLSVIIVLLSALGAYQEGKQRSARLQDQEEALRAHLRARVARGVRQVIGRREGTGSTGGALPDPAGSTHALPSPAGSTDAPNVRPLN